VTASELDAILQRLQDVAPTPRVSQKRQLLANAREQILALYQRGYSWRSLARELSTATGQAISADLLRMACMKRQQQRPARRNTSAAVLPTAPQTTAPRSRPSGAHKTMAPASTDSTFGAKGLKL
jgi:lipopolysaccharide biosynthesis regulator YciM